MGNQNHLETSFFTDHSNEYLAPKHTVKQYVLKQKEEDQCWQCLTSQTRSTAAQGKFFVSQFLGL